MRNRYNLMTVTADTDGTAYPDCLSVPLREYRPQKNGSLVRLTQVDLDRFDLFMDRRYKSLDYIDIILWLNNVGSIRELTAGDYITLPAKSDLDTFYIKNRV
jgi:hypothetical protein